MLPPDESSPEVIQPPNRPRLDPTTFHREGRPLMKPGYQATSRNILDSSRTVLPSISLPRTDISRSPPNFIYSATRLPTITEAIQTMGLTREFIDANH